MQPEDFPQPKNVGIVSKTFTAETNAIIKQLFQMSHPRLIHFNKLLLSIHLMLNSLIEIFW